MTSSDVPAVTALHLLLAAQVHLRNDTAFLPQTQTTGSRPPCMHTSSLVCSPTLPLVLYPALQLHGAYMLVLVPCDPIKLPGPAQGSSVTYASHTLLALVPGAQVTSQHRVLV